jgi:hypothetical protein
MPVRLSRLRRIAKSTGLTVTFLIVCIWLSSYRFGMGHLSVDWSIAVCNGAILLDCDNATTTPADWYVFPLAGWSSLWWFDLNGPAFILPLWPFALLFGVPSAYVWYRDRCSIPEGHCGCGYDLTGNVTGSCPECGRDVGSADAS